MTDLEQRFTRSSTATKAVRWPVTIAVTASSSAIGHLEAEMIDISRTGCMIGTPCRLSMNDRVLITIPTLAPFGARVAWSNAEETGLQFEVPLSLFVLDMITERHRRRGDISF